MELLHHPGEIIVERYRILSILGQGGVGITYEAEDLQNSQKVALKVLSLRRMNDWKKMELFEREARILSQLNHPAIPRYLDYFQVDSDRDRSFYIAQQLAEGKSLAVLVENGWQPDENEVRDLATQVLKILEYLHSLTPPVIHRDIKPQNIIRQENGQVFLVDFGAVQDTYHNTGTGGSTVIGTYGYMAPEQFRGQAVLSTDLYGLGTTLLFLLSRKSPGDLPQRKLKIDFRSCVQISQEFADWLDKMLEPVIEDRFTSTKVALAVLRGELALSNYSLQRLRKPKDSPIALTKTDDSIIADIPPVWLRSAYSQIFALVCGIWNLFTPLMIWVILEFGYPEHWNFIIFANLAIFAILFGLLMLLRLLLSSVGSRTKIKIDRNNLWFQYSFYSWRSKEIIKYQSDINQVKLSWIDLPYNKKITFCVIRDRLRKHRFGLFLTQAEKEWLVWEITTFLEKVRS